MMAQTRLLALAAFVLCGFWPIDKADAAVRLCNETSYVLQVAAATRQGVASKTEGWFNLNPGACKNALADAPNDAQTFVYGKSDPAHAGDGLVFDGSERFCVAAENQTFSVEGRRNCRRRGYVEADFAPVASGRGRRLVTFTEKNDFSSRRARTAGIQRLLSDLQYDIGTIDGYGGERTREAESAYKLRFGISGNPKGDDLLRKLIQTARQEADERGLILCNRTQYLVWAASGRLQEDAFQSTGWLPVPAAECTQVINSNLTDRFYFYYAEAVHEDGRPVRDAGRSKIWGGDKTLCTKPTRFTISGDENCSARGFEQRGFVQIDTGAAQRWKVNLD